MTGIEPAATVCGARIFIGFVSHCAVKIRPRHPLITRCTRLRRRSWTRPRPSLRSGRSQSLKYAIKQKSRIGHKALSWFFGRDDRNRTCGLFVPNEARYQTALYPEIKYSIFLYLPCLWDNMWSKLIWPHVFCFLSHRKVAVLKGLWEFGSILMNWIVPCPERSLKPDI